jgi:uncharacterized protein
VLLNTGVRTIPDTARARLAGRGASFRFIVFLIVVSVLGMTALAQSDNSITSQTETVSFVNGALRLAGTLTIPATARPCPAIVMATGSGPQNRDCDMSGFRMFEALAEYFAANGIASLRYDDRGVGGSEGSIHASTLEDFAGDVTAAVSMLRSRPEIDSRGIGVLGHSEGGAVAQLAACRDSGIAFAIMLAGPGMPVRANILAQTEAVFRANGMKETQIAREVRLLDEIFEALSANRDVESLRAAFRIKAARDVAEMKPAMRRALSDTAAYGDVLFAQQMETMNTSWFRSLARYDPAEAVPLMRCPMLALFGEKDLQVPAHLNAGALETIAKSGETHRIEIRIVPEANHLFQKAASGSPTEYRSLEKRYAKGVLEAIGDWLKKTGVVD